MVGLSEEDIHFYVDSVMACLPPTEKRLMEIQKHQETDPILDKFSIDQAFLTYWSFSGELSLQDGLLLNGIRIVIPTSIRAEILCKRDEGHLA